MNAVAAMACMLALPWMAGAQNGTQNGAKRIHLEGEQARTLISLVANGSAEINQRLREGHATQFTLTELNAMKSSTYKYDPSDPYFRLDIYHGQIKLPGSDSYLQLSDGWAMYEFLNKLGLPHDGAMEGDYIEAANVHCVISPKIAFGNAKRFTCDLERTS
jgi:hypothetical protein